MQTSMEHMIRRHQAGYRSSVTCDIDDCVGGTDHADAVTLLLMREREVAGSDSAVS